MRYIYKEYIPPDNVPEMKRLNEGSCEALDLFFDLGLAKRQKKMMVWTKELVYMLVNHTISIVKELKEPNDICLIMEEDGYAALDTFITSGMAVDDIGVSVAKDNLRALMETEYKYHYLEWTGEEMKSAVDKATLTNEHRKSKTAGASPLNGSLKQLKDLPWCDATVYKLLAKMKKEYKHPIMYKEMETAHYIGYGDLGIFIRRSK